MLNKITLCLALTLSVTAPACAGAGSDSGQETSEQRSQLAKQAPPLGNPVESYLGTLTGSWYGEVPDFYKACATFSEVAAETPWKVQTVRLHALTFSGEELMTVEFAISRNSSRAVREPVYFVKSRLDESSTAAFPTGAFVLGTRSETSTEAVFWRHTVTPNADGDHVAAEGIAFKLNTEGALRGTLQVGNLNGNVYCSSSEGDGVCGSGAWFPFNMQRRACTEATR
jgi:hypothetical protein